MPGWLDSRGTGVQSAVDSATGTGFYKLLSILTKSYIPDMSKFHISTIGNCWNNNKTAPISLNFVDFEDWTAWLCSHQRYFITVNLNTYVTKGMPGLFHILTNWMYVLSVGSPTGPCHGPWTGNVSRRFRRYLILTYPNVVQRGFNVRSNDSSIIAHPVNFDMPRTHVWYHASEDIQRREGSWKYNAKSSIYSYIYYIYVYIHIYILPSR